MKTIKKIGYKPFSKIRFKNKSGAIYPHLTLENAVKAGESAFLARIPLYSNPYKEQPLHGGWIRGFKRAERDFFARVRLSQKIQETIGLEEVEA
jgi:hypothetical protein